PAAIGVSGVVIVSALVRIPIVPLRSSAAQRASAGRSGRLRLIIGLRLLALERLALISLALIRLSKGLSWDELLLHAGLIGSPLVAAPDHPIVRGRPVPPLAVVPAVAPLLGGIGACSSLALEGLLSLELLSLELLLRQ